MDINTYIQERVDNQIQWYDQKAATCKMWYKIFQTAEIVLAALIPLLSAYASKHTAIAIITGILGVIITILETISKVNNYHENWIEYRTTCELLRYQKYLYITKSSPYNLSEETIDNLFVKNIEQIISSENNHWKSFQQISQKSPDSSDTSISDDSSSIGS